MVKNEKKDASPGRASGERPRPDATGDITDSEKGPTPPKLEASAWGIIPGMLSLLMGLASGIAIYFLSEFGDAAFSEDAASLAGIAFVYTLATSWVLIVDRGALLRGLAVAILIAATVAVPSYFLFSMSPGTGTSTGPEASSPLVFWQLAAAPLIAYLAIVWAKSIPQSGFIPTYQNVFLHGLTVPLIASGASILAGLALALLLAWAGLLRSMGVLLFFNLFHEAFFNTPFFGAIAGLGVAMMRAQQQVLGALRYILLLFCRILMPITALWSVTFLFILATKGAHEVYDIGLSPASTMIALAFVSMLIFNGVYQNGEGAPPALWLRLATLTSLVALPVYAGLAAHALWIRVGDYGLTPPRIEGLTFATLAFIYSIGCLGGVLSEVNWRTRRWMPLIAPLNTVMIPVWVLALLIIPGPIADPWTISARSQETRLVNEKISAENFDFGYLRFSLGAPGNAALERLYSNGNHPEIVIIRSQIDRVRAAKNWYHYNNPNADIPQPEEPGSSKTQETKTSPLLEDGPLQLELNPDEGKDKAQ